jgi:hypothetical protein
MPLAKLRSHELAAGLSRAGAIGRQGASWADFPAIHYLALSSKCLARSDKSSRRPETTKERERLSALVSAPGDSYENPPCVSAAGCDRECDLRQCR